MHVKALGTSVVAVKAYSNSHMRIAAGFRKLLQAVDDLCSNPLVSLLFSYNQVLDLGNAGIAKRRVLREEKQ